MLYEQPMNDLIQSNTNRFQNAAQASVAAGMVRD